MLGGNFFGCIAFFMLANDDLTVDANAPLSEDESTLGSGGLLSVSMSELDKIISGATRTRF